MSLRDDFNFNQVHWPGAGDVDDCAPVAAERAIHAVAPRAGLYGVKAFRSKAGVPDAPGPTGLDIAATEKGLRGLYPTLADLIHGHTQWSWSRFMTEMRAGHVAVLFLKSGGLPVGLQYGFTGIHAVAVELRADSTFDIANPLQPAHDKADRITPSALRAAVQAYSGDRVECVIVPTETQVLERDPIVMRLKAEAVSAAVADATAKIKSLTSDKFALQATVDDQKATIDEMAKVAESTAKVAAAAEKNRIAEAEAERIRSL